jgi:type II secretory pathway pseudopilin PulG
MSPAPPPLASARQGGFSFIEVIIAMSVLIVGSVSVLGLFAIGVNRMVQRRVDARLEQVRPEIDSILQAEVDRAKPGQLPEAISPQQARPLSRRGYALAVTWRSSPFDTPGVMAHADLLYQGQKVRSLIVPLRRSYLDPSELDSTKGGG